MTSPPRMHHSKASADFVPYHDPSEGTMRGEWVKWYKVWGMKMLPFGVLALLTLLLVGITILEHRTEVLERFRMAGLLNISDAFKESVIKNATVPASPPPCQQNNELYIRSEVLPFPKGVVQETSDFHLRSLSSDPVAEAKSLPSSLSLLAMPVGIKQKVTVDKIIQKFPADNFTVMLFHYDGVVDEWNIFSWSKRVIHIAVVNQTKWWFAKRFLHPDIVALYKYIFVWDEDIGVEHFHAGRYISIIEKEGLEISQPALDPKLSEVHHQLTARRPKGKVHRRFYKFRGSGLCFENSTGPPCTGWVEVMVPVFSQAAWRCAWYMIQNDLVHAWGLDTKLGYCAQGERSKKVGIVDEEYVVHYGIPSLGGNTDQTASGNEKNTLKKDVKAKPTPSEMERGGVRRRSYVEFEIFRKRWSAAAKQDQCWADPY